MNVPASPAKVLTVTPTQWNHVDESARGNSSDPLLLGPVTQKPTFNESFADIYLQPCRGIVFNVLVDLVRAGKGW